MAYDLSPDDLAHHLGQFVTEMGIGVIGGCCGTSPEHLAAVIARTRPLPLLERRPESIPSAASIYSQVPFDQDTSFLIIGERANANGSRAFKEALLVDDLDGCVSIGQDQVKEGAHLVDLCVDYVGRDGVADMTRLAAAFATDVAAPVVLDSTEPEVMEAGLERLGGRSLLNAPTSRMAKSQAHVSIGYSAWPESTAPEPSVCSSTRRAGSNSGVEAADRPSHPRSRRRALRTSV